MTTTQINVNGSTVTVIKTYIEPVWFMLLQTTPLVRIGPLILGQTEHDWWSYVILPVEVRE
jgi:hypothetical protein